MSALAVQVALIALAGALGAMGRVFVAGVVDRGIGALFPWGTLAVNLTGCAAIGALAGVLLAPGALDTPRPTLWLVVTGGLLGSFTTVSSFALQTLGLVRAGRAGHALGNVALTMAGALAAAGATFAAVSALVSG